ncbi:MAG: leucine-rich repeat domain-containing protein, partial [Roseburia sp.]|nr:leucine-rich repeat domain-containing protein [Roseburia sp.]
KVHSGKYGKSTTWYYNTDTKTVTIDCKGKLEDMDDHWGLSPGWRANSWNMKAKRVVFRKGITYIGAGAFMNFQKIEEVVLPEGLVSIGYAAFVDTLSLKKIRFPSSLKRIGRDAFDGSGIEAVSLKNVKKVRMEAFSGAKLKSLTIPAGCEIGSYAFISCEDLKTVTIEEGVETIRNSMFSLCGFESVTIPSSVTTIEKHAFFSFSPEQGKLKQVTIRSKKIKKWGEEIFGNARKDLVIKVPKSKRKEYTKALWDGGLPKYVKIVAW